MNHMSFLFSKISVIGLGYIGLPTAALFASRKCQVVGVDVNQVAVDTINRGQIHIIEPELDIIVRATVADGYLRAVSSPEPADAFLIAVPTPFKENHEPDLSYVQSAIQAIAPVLKKGDLVVLESTSPVGTTEIIAQWLAELRPDLSFPLSLGESSDIRIAFCPERVLPGHIMRELVENDRIIGGLTSRCAEMAKKLYEVFVEGECIITSARMAEMCKLTENSFRDVNIAFANELSMICDKLEINVWDLISLANRHPRVSILNPSTGVGGHCIAVDPWFVVSKTPEEAALIRAAREVNDFKPQWVLKKIKKVMEQYLISHTDKVPQDITIAILGLTFKANIDDLRESPALEVASSLVETHVGCTFIVEPHISELPLKLYGKSQLSSLENALKEANVVIKLVDHDAFKHFNVPNDLIFMNFCSKS